MKFSEIAEATDLKESAVKMRFYRGISELQTRVNSNNKKLRVITILALVAGIFALSTTPAYAMSASTGAAISATVGSTLGFTFSTMISSGISSSAAGASAVAGGLFATTTAKVIAGSAVLLATAGIGLGAMSISNNDIEPEDDEDMELRKFSSKEYTVSFEYPEELGIISSEIDNDTENEVLSFLNLN